MIIVMKIVHIYVFSMVNGDGMTFLVDSRGTLFANKIDRDVSLFNILITNFNYATDSMLLCTFSLIVSHDPLQEMRTNNVSETK